MTASDDAIVSWAKRSLGDDLRVVTAYGPDDHRLLYARADIEAAITDEVLDRIASLLRGQNWNLWGTEWPTETGELCSTVRVLGEVVSVNLPEDRECGVAVTFDADAKIDLQEFVGRARSEIMTR